MAKRGYSLRINMNIRFPIYIEGAAAENGSEKSEAYKEPGSDDIIQGNGFSGTNKKAKQQNKDHTGKKTYDVKAAPHNSARPAIRPQTQLRGVALNPLINLCLPNTPSIRSHPFAKHTI